MPTLPSGSAPHHHRQLAESFGADAERYDRTRPRYPQALVHRILAASPGTEILDVGCGTGIEARQFQAAGDTVLGLEPDPRMADFARNSGIDVVVTTFEAWDSAGRTFDAIISGTAWHWVDPVAGAAKAAQVLRPGGRLATFWNVGQAPPDATKAFAEVYRRIAPDGLAARAYGLNISALQGYSRIFERTADGIRAAGRFDEPEQWQFDWERTYARDEWLDQLPTQGDHSQFSSAQLEDVLTGIGAAVDTLGGRFTMTYTAVVVTASVHPS